MKFEDIVFRLNSSGVYTDRVFTEIKRDKDGDEYDKDEVEVVVDKIAYQVCYDTDRKDIYASKKITVNRLAGQTLIEAVEEQLKVIID